jgi:hypothetical protein
MVAPPVDYIHERTDRGARAPGLFKFTPIIAAAAGLLILTTGAASLCAQEAAHPAHEGPSVSIPVDQIKYVGTIRA